MIAQTIQRYYPEWVPPEDNGRDWIACNCPFHGDETPSAAVSYQRGAFNCLACGVSGDVYSIIQRKEGVNFGEAIGIAEGIAEASGNELSRPTAGKSGGRAPEGEGLVARRPTRASRKVPARVRRRPLTGL